MPAGWALSLTGLVSLPRLYTAAALNAFPVHDHAQSIVCAAPPLSAPTTRIWRGLLLSDLLAETDLLPTAAFVTCYAIDGYSTVLPIAALENALLSYAVDENTLHVEDGAPLRLIVPGQAGYKQIKWLYRLNFTELPEDGYWERRGYPLDGRLRPMHGVLFPDDGSRIESGMAVQIAGWGVACTVEVSVNDGGWVTVHETISDDIIAWEFVWVPALAGVHTITVRTGDQTTCLRVVAL